MENCNCVHSSIGAVTAGLITNGHGRAEIAMKLIESAALLCIQMRSETGKLKGGRKDFKNYAEEVYVEMKLFVEKTALSTNLSLD